jgi:hypothetical protein
MNRKTLKCTAISDTHTNFPKLKGGDILIHAGDSTYLGQPKEVYPFLDWLAEQDYTHKIFIAGNHDLGFEPIGEGIDCHLDTGYFRFRNMTLQKGLQDEYKAYAKERNIIYLHSELVIVEGLRIYGSPYQPEFCGWAFNLPRSGEKAQELYSKIPEKLDILITHGPPKGVRDKVLTINQFVDNREGCQILRNHVRRLKPRYHIFGHIHEGYGRYRTTNTYYINAAYCQRSYKDFNSPVDFLIKKHY